MKKISLSLVLVFLCSCASAALAQQAHAKTKADELKASGTQFVEMLSKENYTGAAEMFDAKLKRSIPAEKLQRLWRSVISEAGPLRSTLDTEYKQDQKSEMVTLKCQFENSILYIRLGFDAEKKINSFDVDDK